MATFRRVATVGLYVGLAIFRILRNNPVGLKFRTEEKNLCVGERAV